MTVEALKSIDGITSREAERSKNFFALGLMLVALPPPDRGRRWRSSTQKFGKRPGIADANTKAFRAGYNYGETSEDFAVSYEVAPAKLAPGRYRQITGNTALALRAHRGLEALRPTAVPRRLPDHSGLGHPRGAVAAQELRRHDVSGRGRDRGLRGRARRVLRRRARRHHLRRPGHRPQGRDGRPGRDARAAAPRPRRPARRPLDRDADQAGAGGSAACALRPQRRDPGARRRRLEPLAVLRRGDRGCADRAQVPDARVPALRRRPRERLGAVADPGRREAAVDRDEFATGPNDGERTIPTCATPRRWRAPGRCRGRPGSSTGSVGSRRRT